jgi:anti-sigma factor RsiW
MDAKLQAYYDGELSRLGSWLFERRLAASASLRSQLAELSQLSQLVRGAEAAGAEPDFWPSIARELERDAVPRQRESSIERDSDAPLAWVVALLKPAGVVAVAAAAVLALVRGDGLWGASARSRDSGGVVRWIDSGSRSVMVIEDESGRGATLVWVLDAEPSDGDAPLQGEG